MGEETAVAPSALGTEAVELLAELIRADTVNPPGNEGRGAGAARRAPPRRGLRGRSCSRPSRAARTWSPTCAGEADGPTLCLLGHVDTVPADPDEWTFSPWSGDVVDGEVRGRGAQDMKGQVAAEAAAAISLASSGWRPAPGR